jgi:hypothetical protein
MPYLREQLQASLGQAYAIDRDAATPRRNACSSTPRTVAIQPTIGA